MGATTETSGSREEHTAAGWAARAAPVVAVGALVAGVIATGTIGGGGDRIQQASAGDETCQPTAAPAVMGQSTLTAGELEAWWWAEHGTMELPVDDADGEPLGIGRVAAYYIGNQSGVRGDIAFAQAVLESDWFTVERSSAGNYNFGGVPAPDAPEGTTPEDPEYYASYATPAEGIQAHLDHLHLHAEGEMGADTWDEIGDHWAVDMDGHEYWYGDGQVGGLHEEMTDHAAELAAQREAESADEAEAEGGDDAADEANDQSGDEDVSDDPDETTSADDGDADEQSGQNDDADAGTEDDEGSEEAGERTDDEDCDDVDPCEQTAADLLGYTEPSLSDDFVDFDADRWQVSGAEPPAADEGDGDDEGDEDGDDRTPPIEVDNETLTLTTRVDEPGRITMTSALGQQHGLWEVRARLPLDAEGYHSSIGLTIRPEDDDGTLQPADDEDAEADEPEGDEPEGDEPEGDEPEGDEPEGDEQESEDDPPPPLIFMDNAVDEPTGRLVSAAVPVHREFTAMDEGDDTEDPQPEDDGTGDDASEDSGADTGNDDAESDDADSEEAESDDAEGDDAESEEAAEVDWRYRIETAETELDDNRWHNWAVEWTPDAVRLYLDGELWYETPEGAELPEGEAHLTIETESRPLLMPLADDEASGETDENAESLVPDGPGEETAEEYHFGIDRVRAFELMGQDDECDPPDDDEDPPPTTEQTTTTVEDPPETTTTTAVEEPPESTTTTTVDDTPESTTTTQPESTTSTTVRDAPEPSSEPPSTGQEGSPRTPSAASTQTVGTPRLTG